MSVHKLQKLFDENFKNKLNSAELGSWLCMGREKQKYYPEIIRSLQQNYQKTGCRMSMKIHFLHSYFSFILKNPQAVSDKVNGFITIYIYIYIGGSTTPSGPGPPHSRGF